jgi:uracil-DNA glycosylase
MTIRSWIALPFFKSVEYNKHIESKLNSAPILPAWEHVFASVYQPSGPDSTKVVVLGQDPYPTPGHANGYAFSVNKNIKLLPKSLQNIFRELVDDLGCNYPEHGDLTHWAKQGVMLLNTCLTVEPFKPGSHRNWGWQQLAREVICTLVEQTKHKVFILWGKDAQAYADYIDSDHLVLKAPHPSPLSAYLGFFGSKPFSQTNAYLAEHGIEPITWGTYGQKGSRPPSTPSQTRREAF